MNGLLPLAAALTAIAALGVAEIDARDLVIYNHSPSIEPGFYLRVDADLTLGAFVTVRAAEVAPAEAAAHGFGDQRDRFIKRIAAQGGDEVCVAGQQITINGALSATRRPGIAAHWHGCQVLRISEVLLLGDSDYSFDGRYWGPTDISIIEGVWKKL